MSKPETKSPVSAPNRTSPPISTELHRSLGLISALSIGVGTMIAAGIFTLSGLAVRNVGSAAIVSFLIAAVVAGFTALTYCEFSSLYPESGEGYLYARKTFPPPVAYFVGWALFLGYTSSCAFYLASLSVYFQEFIWHSPWKLLGGTIALIGLTLLNIKGTKESGGFQVIVTAVKVALLLWFVVGGFSSINLAVLQAKFDSNLVDLIGTSALVFITFFGFSAIAAAAGETINPTKTIPRAIFLSMGIVTVLYTLVVLVVVCAGLKEYTEAAMGIAAQQFLGNIGGYIIVFGALFSMISASNASIMAGSRVAMTMSHLGHFPPALGTVHPKTQTPIKALAAVCITILVFTLALNLENLAHFADAVLLTALITVNLALIFHRQRYPDLKRPFKVPLVPLTPLLGIAANAYLLYHALEHPRPLFAALSCLTIGVIGFFVWKIYQPMEEAIPGTPSKIALARLSPQPSKFRILLPIANPQNITTLVDAASAIAKDKRGEILILRVIQVPEQTPLESASHLVPRESRLLEKALERSQRQGVPSSLLIRIGHEVSRAILETGSDHKCNLLVLGWKGYPSTARRIMGDVVDNVVQHAQMDLMLIRLANQDLPRNLLLPTAGGEHARRAEELALSLAKHQKGSLTLCRVVPQDASPEQLKETEQMLQEAQDRLQNDEVPIKVSVIRHSSAAVGILQEVKQYDGLVIGATGTAYIPQVLFGSIPEQIAKHCSKPVILVKRHHPMKSLWGKVMHE